MSALGVMLQFLGSLVFVVCAVPGDARTSLQPSPSKQDPVSWITAHHKSGWALSDGIALVLRARGMALQGPYTWFGQPLIESPLEKIYNDTLCANCMSLESGLHRGDRLVNLIRDPISLVVSGYKYHYGGQESEYMTFGVGGERGGDLRQFRDSDVMALHTLPVASAETLHYPAYLQQLNASDGLLAEMLRVYRWEMPEMMSSVQVTKSNAPNFLSICMESFTATKAAFDEAIDRLEATLGVPPPPPGERPFDFLFGYEGNHSTTHSNVSRDDAELERLVLAHDSRFDGYFRKASEALPCAPLESVGSASPSEAGTRVRRRSRLS